MHFELGCYGDGVLGHQHTRERCADILRRVAENTPAGAVSPGDASAWATALIDLRQEMSDDAEEEQTACDLLNFHAHVAGALWGWQDGDFGLWPIDAAADLATLIPDEETDEAQWGTKG